MSAVFSFLFGLLFLAVILGIAVTVSRGRRDQWQALAAQRGLQWAPGRTLAPGTLTGSIHEIPVRATTVRRGNGKSSTTWTVVHAQAGQALPVGLRVSHEGLGASVMKLFGAQDIQLGDKGMDGELRIQGQDEPAIRALLTRPELRAPLRALARYPARSRIEDDQVVLERIGTDSAELAKLLDAAAALARGLAEASRRPWQELAERHGLELKRSGSIVVLGGTVAGMRVELRTALRDGHPFSRIIVHLSAGLPPGLAAQVAPRDARGEGLQLGDPVLDGVIQVTCPDPEAARALLRDEHQGIDLHGDLLAVIHGHPGSVLTDRSLTLVADTASPVAVDAALTDALTLTRSLGRLLRGSGGQATAASASPSLNEPAAVHRTPPQPVRS